MENVFVTKSDSIIFIDMDNELVQLLNNEIQKRNLSNRDAAKAIGISHPTLGVILSGEQPSYDSCLKISKFLRMPLVNVLSLAGLLPKIPETTAREEQIIYMFHQLSEYQQQEIINYIDFILSK